MAGGDPLGALFHYNVCLARIREAHDELGRMLFNFGVLIATGPNDKPDVFKKANDKIKRDLARVIAVLNEVKIPEVK